MTGISRSLVSSCVLLGALAMACTANTSGTGPVSGSGGQPGTVAGTGGAGPSPGTGGLGTGGAAIGSGGTGANSAGGGGAVGGRAGGSGGTNGSGGATSAPDGGITAGCNAAAWPTGGPTSPQMIDVTVNGTTTSRQFYFAIPTGYVSSRPYRLVFAWHYAGGLASLIAANGGGVGRYYGLQPLLADTIFVTGQGLPDAQGRTGWPNTNGQDVAFTRALLDWASANFCVDKTRIMSTGFSYGAIMSHTVACQMPDVFRAVGVMSGLVLGRSCVNHPVAAWMTHGTADTSVSGGVDFTAGVAARDRILATNHCGTTTQPVDPAPCVAYDGCDAGYPVVWCPRDVPRTDTGHVIPTFAAAAIATFFSQF